MVLNLDGFDSGKLQSVNKVVLSFSNLFVCMSVLKGLAYLKILCIEIEIMMLLVHFYMNV